MGFSEQFSGHGFHGLPRRSVVSGDTFDPLHNEAAKTHYDSFVKFVLQDYLRPTGLHQGSLFNILDFGWRNDIEVKLFATHVKRTSDPLCQIQTNAERAKSKGIPVRSRPSGSDNNFGWSVGDSSRSSEPRRSSAPCHL